MKIALDAMGGDYAPEVTVEGAILAAREFNTHVILVGNQEVIQRELLKHNTKGLPLSVKHASQVIGMGESPSEGLRKKKDSSIRVAFELIKSGEAKGLVSAGNSGAVLATGIYVLKKLEGVDRPAIAALLPTLKGVSVLLDGGANVVCKSSHLVQFGIMGNVYARYVLGKQDPKVSLLSNGEEDSKGNDVTRDAHVVLKNSFINYTGYVEGMNVYDGSVDVVVCDGFVGNIALKISEGLVYALGNTFKTEMNNGLRSKLAYILAKKPLNNIKKRFDYSEYGGAPLLGIDGIGIISHGNSSARAIKNAVQMAARLVSNRVNPHIIEDLRRNQELQKSAKISPVKIWEQIKEKIIHVEEKWKDK
ncbi:MAG: phosphate--acyl-ACP acyltransferase [Deltaproteobacteria bacterium CG12_big_fil_rev_8_21_14_0_65_43_10]|nr:MAG: phosphate--acyl-ACP acyltransferase [Deltaproteobacteria bacterium CG2_30_43_15]PIQ46366.1 MAG: phosphate--acyl-ACP acyltransferase [Deltaproteobacteria bacterium CG12_big_fil_rev_8_21_14_0_65_43_10]PIU84503.1 MAG: phosphate--acyl-ACP acyltransferase [Deltaproteobacteria bacterium CG06_land_8_20_14_3_00_44_19]PIX23395.1 MAG: phosphate--acyl-ACP acyltransferase [Deltaproteobacteria bacterium CG_4_8_14_3_um_filter_43_13]HCX89764.1 phosphate acyltransferase PlsX [Deltaproteobacteria bacter